MDKTLLAIAQCVDLTFSLHEESWDDENQEYRQTINDCLQIAAKTYGISPQFLPLIDLALTWPNDISLWASNILKPKT